MRNRLFLFAALAVLGTACAKEETFVPSVGESVTFTASFADEVTKTTLVEGNKVEWNAGDQICFFDKNTTIRTQTEDSGASARFTVEGLTTTTWNAVYPYNPEFYYSSNGIAASVSAVQTGKVGSFANNLNVAVAKAEGTTLPFKNVCGLIKFTLTQENIASVKFSADGCTGLAGRITVDFDDSGIPNKITYRDTPSELVMYPEGETFEPGTYYFVSLPAEFTGFTLTLAKKDLSVAKRIGATPDAIERNRVLDLGEVDRSLAFAQVITFADPLVKAACVEGGADIDNDGEISFAEAAAVTAEGMAAIKTKMDEHKTEIVSFDELKYFTGFANNGKNLETTVEDVNIGQFEGYTMLKSVCLPVTVTKISLRTFAGCTALEHVGLHEYLTNIYNNAFNGCTALKEFHIPNNVVGISNAAFINCTALENVYLPNSLTSIGGSVFKGCTALTKIWFDGTHNSIDAIGASAFEGCENMKLESRNLKSLKTLGKMAFKNCAAITKLTMPGVKEILEETFSGCSKLEEIKIEKVTKIGDKGFYKCSKLTSVQYSDDISEIGEYGFADCKKLTSVKLSENMTVLDVRAFRATKITEVTVPASITELKNQVFYTCASLNHVVMLPVNPPALKNTGVFQKSTDPVDFAIIYVPDESFEAYREADVWKDIISYIKPISEKPAH